MAQMAGGKAKLERSNSQVGVSILFQAFMKQSSRFYHRLQTPEYSVLPQNQITQQPCAKISESLNQNQFFLTYFLRYLVSVTDKRVKIGPKGHNTQLSVTLLWF